GAPDDLTSLVDAIFEAQRVQWEALCSWQQSLATCGKDFWEQWAVRYAGGMTPINSGSFAGADTDHTALPEDSHVSTHPGSDRRQPDVRPRARRGDHP